MALARLVCYQVNEFELVHLAQDYVEYLAAGTLPEAAARLSRTIVRWLKLLACIPQRIFPLGPIPQIASLLKIGLGALR